MHERVAGQQVRALAISLAASAKRWDRATQRSWPSQWLGSWPHDHDHAGIMHCSIERRCVCPGSW